MSNSRPPGPRRGGLPAEVRRVIDRGVVALAAGRREEMRGVAGKEGARGLGPVVEALRNEREPRGPLADAEQLERELASRGARERRAGERLGGRLAGRELRVEHEEAPSVDRRDQAPPLPI